MTTDKDELLAEAARFNRTVAAVTLEQVILVLDAATRAPRKSRDK